MFLNTFLILFELKYLAINSLASNVARMMNGNMYINEQDAQISVIKLYFLIRYSTCFGLY